MDLAKIKKLLAIVAESDVAEVEIEEEGLKVVVRKNAPTVMMQQPPAYPPFPMGFFAAPPASPAVAANSTHEVAEPAEQVAPPAAPAPSAPAAAAPAPAPEGVVIRAPIVGTFYRSPSPDSDPFVKVGDRVQPGDVLCIIEAMKLMNEITSEYDGEIVTAYVENGKPVQYGERLFAIRTD